MTNVAISLIDLKIATINQNIKPSFVLAFYTGINHSTYNFDVKKIIKTDVFVKRSGGR